MKRTGAISFSFGLHLRRLSLGLLLLVSLYSLSRPVRRSPVPPPDAAGAILLAIPNNDRYLNTAAADNRGNIAWTPNDRSKKPHPHK